MISKIISPGKSFKGLCEYLCKDQKRSLVLQTEGVRDYDYRLMAADFELQRRLNPNLQSPVQHIILSYYPGERITDELMVKIAKEYLEKLNITSTQYAIVKHNDRDHPHTHLIINRVNGQGKTIDDSWIGLRGKKIAQELTRKYGLIQAENKTPELTHLERLNEYEATRYRIYETIREALSKCSSLEELKARLEKQHIEMSYKYKGQTREVQGVSFKMGEFKFKGSAVDRQFSIKNLERLLSQNQSINQEKSHTQNSGNQGTNQPQRAIPDRGKEIQLLPSKDILEELMKAQEEHPCMPDELLQKKRKKKKSEGHHL